jgi:hypothetical protein
MPTVEKLVAQLTDLRVEERELTKLLDANRRKQATIMSSLQVKPDAKEEAPTAPKRRPPSVRPGQAAEVLRQSMRSNVRPVSTPVQKDRSAAELVREHVATVADGVLITPEIVATTLGLKSSTVSIALNRMAAKKTIERVPGSQRGKFRKINRAA